MVEEDLRKDVWKTLGSYEERCKKDLRKDLRTDLGESL